jgi:hypothetical protein
MNTYQAIQKYAAIKKEGAARGGLSAKEEKQLLTMRRNFARRYLAIRGNKKKTRNEQKEMMDIREILIDRYAELNAMPNLMADDRHEYEGLAKFLGLPGDVQRTPLQPVQTEDPAPVPIVSTVPVQQPAQQMGLLV